MQGQPQPGIFCGILQSFDYNCRQNRIVPEQDAQVVAVYAGRQRRFSFYLSKMIRGVTRDRYGNPLANVVIKVFRTNPTGNVEKRSNFNNPGVNDADMIVATTISDANGNYSVVVP